MTFDERLTLMRRDISTMSKKHRPNLFERSRGFSKIKIQEDENDKKMYLSHRREKYMNVSKFLPDARNYVLTDDDIYVYYPIPRPGSKLSTIVTISELNDFKRRSSVPMTRFDHQFRPVSTMFQSKYPIPSYTDKLRSVSAQNFDQYTDGTMHLEERRLRQRQREFVPPQVGHLPIQKRNHSEKAELIQAQIEMNPHLLSNVATLPAKNIKIYLPKSAKRGKENEDDEEQKRFLRLKQEHQAQEYAKVVAGTSKFLGKEPSYLHSIQRPNLHKEEFVLLDHMRKKMLSLKTTAIIISWLTQSCRKASKNTKHSMTETAATDSKPGEYHSESVLAGEETKLGIDHEVGNIA